MADFCKQCSIENFGEDTQDLAFLGGYAPTLLPNMGYPTICEGCGITMVNDYGECIDHSCLREHNAAKV